MSIVSKLTVTPLLYACGALLLVCIGLGVRLSMLGADVRAAEAATGQAEAQRDAAITERDAWKTSADSNAKANNIANTTIDGLVAKIDEVQAECRRNDAANDRAIAAARAEARDADRTLTAFTAQFQTESRKPACQQALARLEDACPALRNY